MSPLIVDRRSLVVRKVSAHYLSSLIQICHRGQHHQQSHTIEQVAAPRTFGRVVAADHSETGWRAQTQALALELHFAQFKCREQQIRMGRCRKRDDGAQSRPA
jgi:hypothetical protein